MLSDEFKKLGNDWGLTQSLMAKFLGVEERTVRRFASGESAIPQQTAILLRLLKRMKRTPEYAYRLGTGEELRD